MRPTLASANPYQVALIGEALGETEADLGEPFQGKAGFRLTRLIEWAGLERSRFDIYNAAWCRPPGNKLEGLPFESVAINHCRTAHWGKLLPRSRVLVPMGNVATGALTGHKGILGSRGYLSSGPGGVYIIPTVHPSFIQRGQSRWSAAFINDIQKAVELAQNGHPPQFTEYLLDPTPARAYQWALEYRRRLEQDGSLRLAFDIETPGKGDEEDSLDFESGPDDLDIEGTSWFIWRIGFSYAPLQALSIPWEPPFFAAIKLLLDAEGDKIVWNAGFDVPRIRRTGVADLRGTIHDGMVAWHILHSDLPKSLRFVATFTCPWQPAWKHLSGAKPAFYNATDADVEWRSMEVIDAELRRAGLWEVYQRDVLDLQPVLDHMSRAGMRIDPGIRGDRAVKLAGHLARTRAQLEALVPIEARRIEHVYVRPPTDTQGLYTRPGSRQVPVCNNCGAERPTKHHFRTLKKTRNPCENAGTRTVEVAVVEYYRLADFKLSRNLLIGYHNHLNRPLPLVWDAKAQARKVSFDEEQMKKLMLKYPLDELYPTVLQYRSIDKLAGTYIGRPVDDSVKS